MPIEYQENTSPVLDDFYKPQEQPGMASPTQNDFYSERTGFLWGILGDQSKTIEERRQRAKDFIASTPNSIIKQTFTDTAIQSTQEIQNDFKVDFSVVMAKPQPDVEQAQQAASAAKALMDLSANAQAAPEAALAEATVWNLNPNLGDSIRNSFALHDYMAGQIAGRVEGDSLFKKGLDFLSAAVVPLRMSAGQFQANHFYDTLHTWNTWDAATKYRNWDRIEKDLWDAAGNNSLVYMSLVAPFLDPSDEINNKVDAGIDAATLGTLVFSGVRLANVLKGMNRLMDFRELAKATGNTKLVGETTVGRILEGDSKAIMEGHGVALPKTHVNEETGMVEDVAGPTQSVLTQMHIADGTAGPNTAPLALQIGAMTEEEKRQKLIFLTSRIVSSGTIKSVDEDARGAGLTIKLDRPTLETKTPRDINIERRTLRKKIKDTKSALAAEIANNPPGQMSAAGSEMTSLLEEMAARDKVLTLALAEGRKLSKGGLKVSGLKVPSVTEETLDFAWTVDDLGRIRFDEKKISSFSHFFLSKESTLDKGVKDGLTAEGTIVDMQQRKVYADYAKFYQKINQHLKSPWNIFKWGASDPRKRVEAVLMRGDFEKRVFSEQELRRGVDTDLGKLYFSEKEVQAYMGSRIAFDELWYGLNKMRREEREFAGHKAFVVNYTDKEGMVHPVPIYAHGNKISHSIPVVGNVGRARHVLYATTGDVVDLTKVPSLEADLVKQKKGFVELTESYHTADGKMYDYMLVDVDHIGGLKHVKQAKPIPYQVLPYRPGYVPKLVTDPIYHVVEAAETRIRNGLEVAQSRAVAGFQSRKEAEIFLRNADIKYFAKPSADPAKAPSKTWRLHSLTSDWKRDNKETVDFINEQLFKGAFAGDRTDGAFKIGLDLKEGQRMGAFDAMQRYADYVGRHAPMHAFKQGRIKQFLDAVNNPPRTAGSMLENTADWTSKLHSKGDHAYYRNAKNMQDWMLSTFAVPSSQESRFGHLADNLATLMDSVIFKDGVGGLHFGARYSKLLQAKLLQSKWARDPFQAARALSFDMYLGMFNPVQMIVQSAGMLTPGLLHPVEATKVMPKFLALRTLHSMASVDDAAAAAKMMGLNGAEFKTMLNAFRRSGVADSIMNAADFGTYVNHIGGYYSPGMWETIKKNGRVFYNLGELNNRMFSWTLGYERKMAEKGWSKVKTLKDDQVIEVTKEGLRLGMNMSSANRAKWQQNPVLALPTQFWKVTTQFYENMLSSFFGAKKGAAWTKSESAAAFFNTMLLMGAAGYSVDELWTNYEPWLINQFNLDPANPADQAKIAAARGGFLELMSLQVFGAELDISDRVGVASGINMIYENTLKPLAGWIAGEQDVDMSKALLGASYGIKTRLFDAVANVLGIFRTASETSTWNKEIAIEVGKSLATIPSSTNNAYTAYVWHVTNTIPVKSTGETFGMEPGASVEFAKAIGIDPLAIEKFYIVDRDSKEYDKLKMDISKSITKIVRDLYDTGQYQSESGRDFAQKRIEVLASGLEGRDREMVVVNALNALDQDSKTDRLIVKMIDGILNADDDPDIGKRNMADIKVLENLNTGTQNAE